MAVKKTLKAKILESEKVEKSENLKVETTEPVVIELKEPEKVVKKRTEEEKKLEYEKYKNDNKIEIDKEITSAANTFHIMKNDELIALAYNYDVSPFSMNTRVADALAFELAKRKLKSAAFILSERLKNAIWYTKPWSRF